VHFSKVRSYGFSPAVNMKIIWLLADFGEMKGLSQEGLWINLKRGWASNISCLTTILLLQNGEKSKELNECEGESDTRGWKTSG
jgi:hypothetical protein